MFTTATTGLATFNLSFEGFLEALLSTTVLIGTCIIMTNVGGQGIQKPVRNIAMTLGVCALFLKGYITLTTGTLALF